MNRVLPQFVALESDQFSLSVRAEQEEEEREEEEEDEEEDKHSDDDCNSDGYSE